VLVGLLRPEIEVCLLTALGLLSSAEVLVNDGDKHMQHDNYVSLKSAILIELDGKEDGNSQFATKNHPTMKRTMIHDCRRGISGSAVAELYKTFVQFSDEKSW
jgi:hypothetical protein